MQSHAFSLLLRNARMQILAGEKYRLQDVLGIMLSPISALSEELLLFLLLISVHALEDIVKRAAGDLEPDPDTLGRVAARGTRDTALTRPVAVHVRAPANDSRGSVA